MPYLDSGTRLARAHNATTLPDRPSFATGPSDVGSYPQRGQDPKDLNDWVVTRPNSSTHSERARIPIEEPALDLSSGFPNRFMPRAQSVPGRSYNPRDQYKLMQKSGSNFKIQSVNDQTFRKTHDPGNLKVRLAAPIASWMVPGGQGEGGPDPAPPKWFARTDPAIFPKYMKTSFPESALSQKDRLEYSANLLASRADADKGLGPGATMSYAGFYTTHAAKDHMKKTLPLGDFIRSSPTEDLRREIRDPSSVAVAAGARMPRAIGTIYNGRPRFI